MNFELQTSLIQGVGLLALLSIGFGIVERVSVHPAVRSALHGLLFGVGAIFAMATPWVFADGLFIDVGNIVVGLVAAFGGLPAAVVSAALALSFKFLIGGPGLLPGVLGIVGAAIAGWSWAKNHTHERLASVTGLTLLGLMLGMTILTALVLPFDTAIGLLEAALAPHLIVSIVSTVVLGMFLGREITHIVRENGWRSQAMTDPLTGLPNRRDFEDALAVQLDNDELVARGGWLLIADIDHFKAVNDTYGHAMGDLALQAVAGTLRSCIRRSDLVCRIGGEEFGALLFGVPERRVDEIAASICQRVRETPVELPDGAISVTISVGVARARHGDGKQELFEAADQALYRAKRTGRDRAVKTGGESGRDEVLALKQAS